MSNFRRKLLLSNLINNNNNNKDYEVLDNMIYDNSQNKFLYLEESACVICNIKNSLTIHAQISSSNGQLFELDKDKNYIDYWGNPNNRVINLTGKERTNFIILNLYKTIRLENTLTDVTNNKVIFQSLPPKLCINKIIKNAYPDKAGSYFRLNRGNNKNCIYFYPTKQTKRITWGTTNGGQEQLFEADSEFKYIDYWNTSPTNVRTVNINANTRYVLTSFPNDSLDYGYIYDETNKIYIYKGKNVVL